MARMQETLREWDAATYGDVMGFNEQLAQAFEYNSFVSYVVTDGAKHLEVLDSKLARLELVQRGKRPP